MIHSNKEIKEIRHLKNKINQKSRIDLESNLEINVKFN